MKKRVLVLHGNRQTGQLFLGRLERIRKRVSKEFDLEFIAPDAPFPHPEDANLRTWWNRVDNEYQGLDESLKILEELEQQNVVGIFGFSQGARFAQLVAMLHSDDPRKWFPNLEFCIMVAGYDAPIPDGFPLTETKRIKLPSFHVWGRGDKLVTPAQSEKLSEHFLEPQTMIHDGNHYVPSKAPQIQHYVDFIQHAFNIAKNGQGGGEPNSGSEPVAETSQLPDEETTAMQEEEIEALQAIFPDEVDIKSSSFPIRYHMKLLPSEEEEGTNWPKHPLTLDITYPFDYPLESIPDFKLIHENNVYQFPSNRVVKLMKILKDAVTEEIGMPSVLSGVYAVRDYLDLPATDLDEVPAQGVESKDVPTSTLPENDSDQDTSSAGPHRASHEDIQKGIQEGLDIAEQLLMRSDKRKAQSEEGLSMDKGGAFWNYTIGLVGKPSAGKSTFFNAASAFSKQRGATEGASEWGGASMAAHPFTTIDPNIGYCLVPAPKGSCPEDEMGASKSSFGSTHGRDSNGQRLIPILLKDVAGLVPGAYKGHGKGNRFLNDLTDATVLIHVVDASGTADAQGNTTGGTAMTNPLDDMQWIRSELVEWVYGNVVAKWDSISRKGRKKLSGMFSGYGQTQALTERIFVALEDYMEERHNMERNFDSLEEWDEADVHRLVSLFLGVRFPIALALNKYDLPTSKKHIREIEEALPIHGAHVGTPLTARSEMNFVKEHLMGKTTTDKSESKAPFGVWQCLSSAIKLREPVLVFPVSDMKTYAPLNSLNERAVGNPSLPSVGMIRCINGSGGVSPSCWNETQQLYIPPSNKHGKGSEVQLRDVIPMKQGSTVNDVFLALKNAGAVSGEFVRAEAAGKIGENPKPVPKNAILGHHNRILKIMTNKRTTWQS
ncbi:unnamed protein product [Cylindrotheca closterium]|uniref:RWD domain-containing protein n=1 Tax=Cylindrotheca closterium TaxID=2856 RepID=A0AAD2FJL5_9STRA|nr:unnamed protein product [Cylindrotheca closterium]